MLGGSDGEASSEDAARVVVAVLLSLVEMTSRVLSLDGLSDAVSVEAASSALDEPNGVAERAPIPAMM